MSAAQLCPADSSLQTTAGIKRPDASPLHRVDSFPTHTEPCSHGHATAPWRLHANKHYKILNKQRKY